MLITQTDPIYLIRFSFYLFITKYVSLYEHRSTVDFILNEAIHIIFTSSIVSREKVSNISY